MNFNCKKKSDNYLERNWNRQKNRQESNLGMNNSRIDSGIIKESYLGKEPMTTNSYDDFIS